MYEEEGKRQEGGTCRKRGELGRAGGQAGIGRKMGREGRGTVAEKYKYSYAGRFLSYGQYCRRREMGERRREIGQRIREI